jgi:hypothetical protein
METTNSYPQSLVAFYFCDNRFMRMTPYKVLQIETSYLDENTAQPKIDE